MSAGNEQGGVLVSEDDYLIGLLRREGRHSGVWFSHHLLTAADRLEELIDAPATNTPEVVRLREALERIRDESAKGKDREAAMLHIAIVRNTARAALAKHPTSPEDAA